MKRDQKMGYVKPLGVIGLLSGSAALILIMIVGDTFGFPASAKYVTYERFNRFMAVLLALQTGSFIAFRVGQRELLGRFDRRLLAIALVTWAAMAVGTADEFWLYSDLPYPGATFEVSDINMRLVSFSLFFFGSLLGDLVLLVLGIRLTRRGTPNRLYAVLFILYLPLFFVGSAIFGSLFAAPALTSTALAGLSLRIESKSSTVELGL